ncbi:ComEA family DNA-binding protein [Leptolyngbya sp. FACHB-711]|uniref:helix-hairpin-helix domain-containing protein n=1 Tax=Leptolyngbya sp. FACHB-711 TaxID=2692813 RepID=UPI00168354DB|nr:ComEA family DNA-binding protein [Leptolyngbya sp. FACHB-711]MBD2025925.1 ComEA family DNA-binding protein [Leptolyngbya sp. FACHB-711]
MGLSDWLNGVTQGKSLQNALHPLRSRLLNDPYYRMQSLEEVRLAAALGIRIDVNQASVDDWLRLPGLSIHQARSLVALTQSGVAFHCLEDIAAALNVPLSRLRPLEPVLQFCYYAPDRPDALPRLNANTATLEELMRLPPIDTALARAIVQHRQSHPYRNLPDLQQRLHLSPQRTADLMHYLFF